MATNYITNPNGTSNLTHWSAEGGTITSTADGVRFKGSAGTGRSVEIRTATKPASGDYMPCGIQIRRNSGTAKIASVSVTTMELTDEFVMVGSIAVDYRPQHVYFPTGQFVALGNLTAAKGTWTSVSGSPNNNANDWEDRRINLSITVEDNKAFDFTIKGVGLYKSNDLPAQITLDSNDSAWTLATPDNSLNVTGTWAATHNEPVETLKWDWGDGTVETGSATDAAYRTRSHTYASPGSKTVKLTASSSGAGITAHTTTKGPVLLPVGTFAASFTTATTWLDVVANGSGSVSPSVSPIDTWAWDWGDGTTTPANPSSVATHTYASAGTYTVELTIHDAATGRTATTTRTVTVSAPPPPGGFDARRDLLTVTTYPLDASAGVYAWDWGDGTTSTGPVGVHTYEEPGTYEVSLVTDGGDPVTRVVVVSDRTTPLVDGHASRLRLEIAQRPAGAPNLVPNPDGELGGWGWSTPSVGSWLTSSTTSTLPDDHGIAGAKLVYRSGGSGAQYIQSAPAPAAAGRWAATQLVMPWAQGVCRQRVRALSTAGAVVGTSAWSAWSSAHETTVRRSPTWQLPAGTTAVGIEIQHAVDSGGGAPSAGHTMVFRRVQVATATTSAALTDIPFAAPVEWRDILSPSSAVKITRAALDLGTLTADVLDPGMDPSGEDQILRSGAAIRASLSVQETDSSTVWRPMFTGRLATAITTYAGSPDDRTRIRITAHDVMSTLTAEKRSSSVADPAMLPHLMEGVDAPYEIDGQTGQIPAAVIAASVANASLADQISLTRDTAGAHAWVSASGVLQVATPGHLSTVPATTLDEWDYSAVAADYDWRRATNSVLLKFLASADGSVPETVYGPYMDAESVAEHGVRQRTWTMVGPHSSGSAAAIAADILGRGATPQRVITSVTCPVKSEESLEVAALELLDLVRVKHADTETDDLVRVDSVSHEITPESWTVTVGFAADGPVAVPQQTAASQVAAPPVTIPVLTFPRSRGSRVTRQSIPNSAWTVLDTFVTSYGDWLNASTGVMTVDADGLYIVSGALLFNTNVNGRRILQLEAGGGTVGATTRYIRQELSPASGGYAGPCIYTELMLTAGATLRLVAYQTSGGSLDTLGDISPTVFSVRREG